MKLHWSVGFLLAMTALSPSRSQAEVVITEFVAENDGSLDDEDGDTPDWIEIHNNGAVSENLTGWRLTDDVQSPAKWQFPNVDLAAGARLVVFASAKDRRTPGQPLHTNFSLATTGEYLALSKPDGTITRAFDPFPSQRGDISFGDGLQVDREDLVTPTTTGKYLVPANGALANTWQNVGFSDTTWTTSSTRIGYQTGGARPGLPIAYWTFDDITENSIAGGPEVNLNGATYSTSFPSAIGDGKSLQFTRSGSNYARATLNVSETAYTVSFWFRTASATTGLYSIAGGTFGSNGHDRHLYLTGGNLGVRLWNNEVLTTTGKNYADNQWHHLSHVYGGTVGGQKVYVDGVQVLSGAKVSSNFDWQDTVMIGFSNDAGANQYHDGQIDEVAIWSEALSPASVASLASGTDPLQLSGFSPYIGTNVETPMRNLNSSIYARFPFQVNRATPFNQASLKVRYDDGFVAYLDGVEVARRNAPTLLPYNATATADRSAESATVQEEIDLSAHVALLANGSHVLAIQGLNDVSTSADYLLNVELSGATVSPQSGIYMEPPTPGTTNATGFAGFVADTTFLPKRGFYTTPQNVIVSSSTLGATIAYTLDGSDPTPTNGTQVLPANSISPPSITIPISTTGYIKAIAYKTGSGLRTTNVDSHTYIFTSQVLTQSNTPPGYPTGWSGRAADYGMDPNVVNTTLPGYSVTDGILSLPTLSMTSPIESLFGNPSGIYYNTQQRGIASERKVSIEWINPDGTPGWHAQCGVRSHGNSSRGHGFTPKHPLRLSFRSDYGYSRLRQDIFSGGVAKFDQILLRGCSTDSMPVYDENISGGLSDGEQRWNNDKATYMRDQYIRDVLNELGHPNCRGVYVNLFINGLYWGLYNVAERPNAAFFSDTYGGAEEEWDVLKDFQEVNDGESTAWNQMVAIVNDAGITDDVRCQKLLGNNPDGTRNPAYPIYIHWPSFRDYMIVHIAAGAEDWPDHNYWVGRRRGPLSEGFRFVAWDQEISNDSLTRTSGRGSAAPFESVGSSPTDNGYQFGPAKIYDKFRRAEPFKTLFRNRIHELFFNNGPLTPSAQRARWGAIQAKIDKAIVAESARWGDAAGETVKKRETTWLNNMNYMNAPVTGYWDAIYPIDIQRFRNVSLYPSINQPSLSLAPGIYPGGTQLFINHAETVIYYTLNGTDPMNLNGTPSAAAQLYSAGLTFENVIPAGSNWKYLVTANAPASTWKNASFNDTAWPSAPAQLGYGDGDETTTIGYGPNAATRYPTTYFRKTFSITNKATIASAKLHLLRDDGAVVYLNGTELLRSNMHPSNTITYTSLATADVTAPAENTWLEFTIDLARLNEGNNSLAIEVHKSSVSEDDLSFDCRVEIGRSGIDAGVVLQQSGTVSARARTPAGEWSGMVSAYYTVAAEPAGPTNIVMSELHYHPANPTLTEELAISSDADEFEFIELQNVSSGDVDFSGAYFAAGIEFHFSQGFILPAGGRCLIVKNSAAFNARYPGTHTIAGVFENATGLRNSGEQLTLVNAAGGTIIDFTYSDLAPWPTAADGGGPSLILMAPDTLPNHSAASSWRASMSAHGNPSISDALALTLPPNGDADADGLQNLIEYALGQNPQISSFMTPEGMTLTIPRVPNADDAIISGQVSTTLDAWSAADLIESTATSLTFRVPSSMAGENRVFIRARVVER